MAKNNANDLIEMLGDLFKNVPDLPKNGQEVLVKIAPWIALIFGILGVIAGLGLIGVSPLGLMGGLNSGLMTLISGVASVAASVMMLMAFPKLQKHQYGGWVLLFWSEVVNVVASLLSFSVNSLLSTIVFGALSFYLLYQIKSYYK